MSTYTREKNGIFQEDEREREVGKEKQTSANGKCNHKITCWPN